MGEQFRGVTGQVWEVTGPPVRVGELAQRPPVLIPMDDGSRVTPDVYAAKMKERALNHTREAHLAGNAPARTGTLTEAERMAANYLGMDPEKVAAFKAEKAKRQQAEADRAAGSAIVRAAFTGKPQPPVTPNTDLPGVYRFRTEGEIPGVYKFSTSGPARLKSPLPDQAVIPNPPGAPTGAAAGHGIGRPLPTGKLSQAEREVALALGNDPDAVAEFKARRR